MANHIYIEHDRVANETSCKFYKRLLVGFIRCFKDENGEVVIPEEFFDGVPDDMGFEWEQTVGEDENGDELEVRAFAITREWECGKDDCGGTEDDLSSVTFSATEDKPKRHLRIVPNVPDDQQLPGVPPKAT